MAHPTARKWVINVITPVINRISRVNPLFFWGYNRYNPLTKWDEPPSAIFSMVKSMKP